MQTQSTLNQMIAESISTNSTCTRYTSDVASDAESLSALSVADLIADGDRLLGMDDDGNGWAIRLVRFEVA